MTLATVAESQTFNFPAGVSRPIWAHTYTELTGLDITAATVMLSVGTAKEPGAWIAPSVKSTGTILASTWLARNPRLRYQLTVPGSTPLFYVTGQITLPNAAFPGLVTSDQYWVWMQIVFGGQTIVTRGSNLSIIAS